MTLATWILVIISSYGLAAVAVGCVWYAVNQDVLKMVAADFLWPLVVFASILWPFTLYTLLTGGSHD